MSGLFCVLIILGVGIAAIFLTYDPGSSNTSDNSTSSITEDTDLLELELAAPNWGLLMSDGEVLELHSLQGSFVVVDLMQTGECIPCQQQTTHLKNLYEDYEGRLEIISLSLVLSDTIERVENYKSDNSISWYVGLDTGGVFGSYFNARSVPTLVIIDDDGYFRWLHVGVWSSEDISETLSTLDR